MKAVQDAYVPRVEETELRLPMIEQRQARNLSGMSTLTERFEAWKRAQIAMTLGEQLPATGSEQPRPGRRSHARHVHRERPPWLRVVQVLPLVAGGAAAAGRMAWNHKVSPVAMAATAALLTGGVAGAGTAIAYRNAPVQMPAAPVQTQSPAALITPSRPAPEPTQRRRPRVHRERDHGAAVSPPASPSPVGSSPPPAVPPPSPAPSATVTPPAPAPASTPAAPPAAASQPPSPASLPARLVCDTIRVLLPAACRK